MVVGGGDMRNTLVYTLTIPAAQRERKRIRWREGEIKAQREAVGGERDE